MATTLISETHSISGFIVLCTALLQFLLKKGGKIHRITGQLYGYAWIVLLASGAYLGSFLITIIGAFGFYFALTGWRIGRLKNNPVQVFDEVVFFAGAALSLFMLYSSFDLLIQGNVSFSIIFGVFGLLFLYSSIKDVLKYVYRKPVTRQTLGSMDWYFEHFTRMSISFIAAITAFAVIQDVFQNNTLNFLLPTLFGVMAIRLYKVRQIKRLGAR